MNISKQQKKVCHFYFYSHCRFDGACKFPHPEGMNSISCPNGIKCKVNHAFLKCPYVLNKVECPSNCEYKHKYDRIGNEKQKQQQIKRQTIIKQTQSIRNLQNEPQISDFKLQKQQEEEYKLDHFSQYEQPQNDQYRQQIQSKDKKFGDLAMDIYQDLKLFEPIQELIQQQGSIDLMFIMDCTSSMGPWIKACKSELKDIVEQIRQQCGKGKVRISFVGYRDHSEKEHRLINHNFTENLDEILNFIKKLPPLGGGDEPEDLAGGLELGLQMDWQSQARYAVIVADAPGHGKKYNDLIDNYSEGDPYGLDPEEQVQRYAQLNINLKAIYITPKTDKMYEILQKSYLKASHKNLEIAKLSNGTQNFGFFIACSAIASLNNSLMQTQKSIIKNGLKILKQLKEQQQKDEDTDQTQFQQTFLQMLENMKIQSEKSDDSFNIIQNNNKYVQNNYIITKDIPKWRGLDNSQQYDAICHSYFIVKDKDVPINWKKPLLQSSQIKTRIRISNQPFSQGAMRYAFYAKDELLDQQLVAKIPKFYKLENYNVKILSKDLESMFICQYLANDFNELIISFLTDTSMQINFVHCFIYELIGTDGPNLFQVENYIQGEYEKYNNNAGWYNSLLHLSSISQAFSHFSWQVTLGYLMIVDLQGVSSILTDPQIHCLNTTRFGGGNLGYEGMLKFFYTHKCNKFCKQLNLFDPTNNQFKKSQDQLFSQIKIKRSYHNHQKIKTLCDLCRYPFEILSHQLQEKIDQSHEKYCDECEEERKKTMKRATCVVCSYKFYSSQYWFLMKRTDFPDRCTDCRRERRENMRKALEQDK